MTQYRTYLDDSTPAGRETILGIQQNGSEFGIGISTNIVCNNINANIITASEINAVIIGFSTLSVAYASSAGIATYASSAGIATYASSAGIATYASSAGYASTAGIATVAQGLTGTPNITVGTVTADSYVASGTTAVYSGAVGVSTIDSNTTSFHYVSFDTSASGVDISNFTSGKKFEIIARNTSGSSRTLVIRTSTTTTGHTGITIGNQNGVVTNGTITIATGDISYINVFNANGTVIGSYTL
jgi:hypothetical protein